MLSFVFDLVGAKTLELRKLIRMIAKEAFAESYTEWLLLEGLAHCLPSLASE